MLATVFRKALREVKGETVWFGGYRFWQMMEDVTGTRQW